MSESASFDPSELRYPVWTLLDKELESHFFFECVASINVPGIGRSLMLFRDPDLAAKFAASIKQPRLAPLGLQYPQQVIDLIDHCQKQGGTHVGINIEFRTDSDGKPIAHGGRFTTLNKFILLLRTNVQAPPAMPN